MKNAVNYCIRKTFMILFIFACKLNAKIVLYLIVWRPVHSESNVLDDSGHFHCQSLNQCSQFSLSVSILTFVAGRSHIQKVDYKRWNSIASRSQLLSQKCNWVGRYVLFKKVSRNSKYFRIKFFLIWNIESNEYYIDLNSIRIITSNKYWY